MALNSEAVHVHPMKSSGRCPRIRPPPILAATPPDPILLPRLPRAVAWYLHDKTPMATNHSRPTDAPPSILLPMLLVGVLVLLVTPPCVVAQPSAPTDDGSSGTYNININSSLAILIIFFTWALFFVGALSVYLHRCSCGNSAAAEGGAVGREARRGLDPAVLESFPTMEFAAVKVKSGKVGALECAVCLSEFSDDDTLRLLPKCCHVFHADCIDAWLASHITCPVCRSNLADPKEVAAAGDSGTPVPPDHVAIDVLEGEDRGPDEADLELTAGPRPSPARFRRWHSEGRSAEREHDRHTLRLPEQVQRELANAGRLWRVESVTGFAGGRDTGSTRGNRSGGRSGWAGRSDRCGFFLRTFSERRMGEGEAADGSSKLVFPAAEYPLDGVGGGRKSGSATDGSKSSSTSVVGRV